MSSEQEKEKVETFLSFFSGEVVGDETLFFPSFFAEKGVSH